MKHQRTVGSNTRQVLLRLRFKECVLGRGCEVSAITHSDKINCILIHQIKCFTQTLDIFLMFIWKTDRRQ